MAPTSPRFPDANSSVTVLRSLSIYLNLTGLDLTPLEKKAQALGFSVNKFLKSEEESKHSSPTFLNLLDPIFSNHKFLKTQRKKFESSY